ncbi:substrate-binding domain-containing protein [Paenarthrobacter sp. NPDC090522]|uniref:substrate-binding domain-containing protein n=1 Tax=Paenarthrobacter sp. NPDC090522 TaxID=3364383 RepID=UPI003816E41B
MLAAERDQRILTLARRDGRVVTTALARELGISEITARRAINNLAAAGVLVRVHGGATLPGRLATPADGSITGLVVPTSDYYYAKVIAGAESVAAQLGTRLVLGVTHYDRETEHERVRRLVGLGVRGVVVATSTYEPTATDTGAWLDSLEVPVVLMERSITYPQTAREYDTVRTDHAYGGVVAVRHLAALGHRSIGLALRKETPTAAFLTSGYRDAVVALGLDGDAPFRALPDLGRDPAGADVVLNLFLDDCLAAGTRAAIVHVDAHASRLVELATARGLRVPEDLSIVAYDDEVAAFSMVPLTAVAPPKQAVGAAAMRLLQSRVQSLADGSELPVQHLSLLPGLAVRHSTTRYI